MPTRSLLSNSPVSRMKELWPRTISNEDQLRRRIVETGKILGIYGFVSFFGSYASGNISARLPRSNRILITPSGLAKAALNKREICTIDLDGEVIKGRLKPTTEMPTHLAIYRRRPNVNAIVHTHPTYATAFAVAKRKIPVVTIEMAGLVGSDVPVARFVIPGTPELGREVIRTLGDGMAVLLQNHGLITTGSTLDEALAATMAIEEDAMLTCLAEKVAKAKSVPRRQVARIRKYIQTEYGQRQNLRPRLK